MRPAWWLAAILLLSPGSQALGRGGGGRRTSLGRTSSFSRPHSYASPRYGRPRIGPVLRREEAPVPQDNPQAPAVAGALIRTEGLGFKHEPASPARLHTIEAGNNMIAQDEARAQPVDWSRGVHQGAPDSRPGSASQPAGQGYGAFGASFNTGYSNSNVIWRPGNPNINVNNGN